MKYDVIVVGIGSIGAGVCHALSKQGKKVLGIEQYDIVHELGSHSGQSRLIRKAYFEHPDYVPLLQRAYQCWADIEAEASTQLYWSTGILYMAPPGSEIMRGVKGAAKTHRLQIEKVSLKEAMERWPQFSVDKSFECLFEPVAGFITPEKAIRTMVQLSVDRGAEIRTGEKVLNIHPRLDGVEVVTTKDTYFSSKVIVTTGAYTSLVASMNVPLNVTQQLLAWTAPIGNTNVGLGEMPCWMIAEKEMNGLYYGFPELSDGFEGPRGLKVAYHRPGVPMDQVDTTTFDSADEERLLQGVLDRYLPSVKTNISTVKLCRYTYSPDEHFIVDFLPDTHERVLIAAGFSGHGFKFAPVIGEALAELAVTGSSALPISFLGLSRFR
jgi:sarcosine oxidase